MKTENSRLRKAVQKYCDAHLVDAVVPETDVEMMAFVLAECGTVSNGQDCLYTLDRCRHIVLDDHNLDDHCICYCITEMLLWKIDPVDDHPGRADQDIDLFLALLCIPEPIREVISESPKLYQDWKFEIDEIKEAYATGLARQRGHKIIVVDSEI